MHAIRHVAMQNLPNLAWQPILQILEMHYLSRMTWINFVVGPRNDYCVLTLPSAST